jgi:cation diffusion facilitator family transporter
MFFLVGGVIIISVIAKETLFRVTRRKGIRLNSPMLIAKAWHHRADSISALAVLLSIFIFSCFPALALINPVTTVVIAGLILHSAWEVGSNAVKELIDFAPSLETIALIEEMAEEVQGVTFTHNIRIRSMGGALYVELTAETDPELTVAEGYVVVKQIREKIMDKVPNVIDVSTLLTPKGEYIRQFLGSET